MFFHMGDDMLGGVNRTHNVNVIYCVPFFCCLVFQGVQSTADAGIIDQNIDIGEFLEGKINQCFDFVFRRNVCFADDNVAAYFFDLFRYLLKPGFIDIGQNKVGVFAGKKNRSSTTDPIGSSGDNRTFTI